MKKNTKYSFNIGDSFATWTVVECVDKKKYRFLCRCSCNKEKIFYKYNLLKGKFSVCKDCFHLRGSQLKALKSHWSIELNKEELNTSHFKSNSKFWFTCKNGHNFKSTIKDFSSESCTSCNKATQSHSTKEQMLEYLYKLNALISPSVALQGCWVINKTLMAAFYIEEKDRRTNFKKYKLSEMDLLKEINVFKKDADRFRSLGFEVEVIKIEKSLSKSVDIAENLMLQYI